MRSLIATLHLRRPRHHGQDDLGSRAIQVETVGNGHEINAGSAKLLDELERAPDPGAREPVEAAHVKPANLPSASGNAETIELRSSERLATELLGEPLRDDIAAGGGRALDRRPLGSRGPAPSRKLVRTR